MNSHVTAKNKYTQKKMQTDIAKAKVKAKRLGVTVEASKRKHKKLDVFKDGKRMASIGDLRYSDFLQHGDEERRRRYKARHSPHRHKKGTPSYYADQILW